MSWLLLTVLLWTLGCITFQIIVFSGCIPRSGIADHMRTLLIVFRETFILFPIMAAQIYIHTNSVGGFPLLRILSTIYCMHTSPLIHVQLFVTPQTTAWQTPLTMELSQHEYWSGLPLPSPGDLPDLGSNPTSPVASALAGRFFTIEPYL